MRWETLVVTKTSIPSTSSHSTSELEVSLFSLIESSAAKVQQSSVLCIVGQNGCSWFESGVSTSPVLGRTFDSAVFLCATLFAVVFAAWILWRLLLRVLADFVQSTVGDPWSSGAFNFSESSIHGTVVEARFRLLANISPPSEFDVKYPDDEKAFVVILMDGCVLTVVNFLNFSLDAKDDPSLIRFIRVARCFLCLRPELRCDVTARMLAVAATVYRRLLLWPLAVYDGVVYRDALWVTMPFDAFVSSILEVGWMVTIACSCVLSSVTVWQTAIPVTVIQLRGLRLIDWNELK